MIGTEVLASREFAARINANAISGVRMTVAREPAGNTEAFSLLEHLRKTNPGLQGGSPAVAAHAALDVLIQAARMAASNDPARIATALQSGKVFKTSAGAMSFDARGERRETLYSIYRWKVAEDGKAVYAPE